MNKFQRIYILVTGGKDSTYVALMLHALRFWIKKPVYLLWGDTGNSMAQNRKIMEGLSEKTGWELIVIKNTLKHSPMKLVINSMKRLPDAKELLNEGKYSKKVFPCCYWLKEKPFMEWLKKEDHSKDVFVVGIKLGDGWQRRRFLLDMIEAEEKFRFNRMKKVWYYYPLRDTVTHDVEKVLTKEKDFWNTPHSGCRVCPILALFNIEKEGERYFRTMRVLKRMELNRR
jgi:3'-phosphoadenosine 5'-phosphosulfate sulfotransferase (PAPS reductase)/FAD synthetase